MNIGVYDLSKLHCACASSTKMEHETFEIKGMSGQIL